MPAAPVTFTSWRERRPGAVEGLWLAFVAVQVMDGSLTYLGVRIFGLSIEANPLVAWYAGALGPAAGLIAAKLFAVVCASILSLTAHHRTIAVLTVIYLVCAIAPWAHVLHTYAP